MTKSLVRRFLAIFSAKVIGIGVTLLATPIVVRLLGSRLYGDYATVLSIGSVALLLVNAGIYDGIRKYLKESDRPEDWSDHVFAFYARVAVVLVTVAVLGILVLIETGLVARAFGRRFELYFVLVAALLATRQAFSISRSTLMGFDREDLSEKLKVSNHLLAVCFGLPLLALGYGVPGLIAGKLLSHLVTAAVGFAIVSRFVDFSYLLAPTSAAFPRRRLLWFNFTSVLLFALFVSIKHVDILLIQLFYGSRPTGYYKAALTLAEFVWFVPRIVQMTLLHSTSELWSQGRREEITELSSRITRYTLLFTMLLVIGLAALAEPTVTIYYGSEFRPAITPLVILLPGAVGFAVARPILAIGQGKGDMRRLIYATGAAALVNLVLNLVLIPRYGITGAAIATSLGYFSMLVFHTASAKAIGFDPVADLRLPNVTVTVVVATVAIFFLSSIIQSVSLSFVVVPVVGFLVYWTVAVAAGAISLDELRELRQLSPG